MPAASAAAAAANPLLLAAQSHAEVTAFIEAFAVVRLDAIIEALKPPPAAVAAAKAIHPDWTDPAKLAESGVGSGAVDADVVAGRKYLHIDVAASPSAAGHHARELFLGMSGLSDKQQRALHPLLYGSPPYDRPRLSGEVRTLNARLDWVRARGLDPMLFITYQQSLSIHGMTQNLTGQVGALGGALSFIEAIEELKPGAIVDMVGKPPPAGQRSPMQLARWLAGGDDRNIKSILLGNGRALVFSASKDANIFQSLSSSYASADEALRAFGVVAKDQRKRAQALHEYAVGEIKTATDPSNLHERMGLASRETQTELRTDRFLLMAILNREFLEGGTARRVMNNRDLRRFSHVFNLHFTWGWDGARAANPAHWAYFKESVKEWCGL